MKDFVCSEKALTSNFNMPVQKFPETQLLEINFRCISLTANVFSFLGCVENGGSQGYQRRSCLPSPSPNTSNISLWNILKNNIGKDLSKVAMPVQLNEPLNTLQRLCEELEYSELLDKAAHTQDPFERMVGRGHMNNYTNLFAYEKYLGFKKHAYT